MAASGDNALTERVPVRRRLFISLALCMLSKDFSSRHFEVFIYFFLFFFFYLFIYFIYLFIFFFAFFPEIRLWHFMQIVS